MSILSVLRFPSGLTLAVGGAGYLASLALPAFNCANGEGFYGYIVLLSGYVGFLGLDPRWLANLGVLWIVGAIFLRRPERSTPVLVALITMILALMSIVIPAAGCTGDPGSVAASIGLASGGYLWVASVCLLCLHLNYRLSRK